MRGAVLSFVSALACASPAAAAARDASPVVIELFTAQGCAYCPQANRLFADFADRKGVLALTFPVDYWDYLGWSDTFARESFTERQQAYVGKLKLREIYTPEVVVDGRREAPGLDRERIEQLIDRSRAEQRGAAQPPRVRFVRRGARVQLGRGEAPRGGLDVWLVRYDPKLREVRVRAGENRGKTVTQRNVVRELVKLGVWSGRPKMFTVPPAKDEALRTVILLQAGRGGRIVGAARAPA
jgi:hypothetical protein